MVNWGAFAFLKLKTFLAISIVLLLCTACCVDLPWVPTPTPTSTPTLTATPSPTPTGECQEAAKNPSFEIAVPPDTSDAQDWTEVLTIMPAARSDDEAYTGDWSMRLGIPRDGANAYKESYSTAWQWLELPAGDVITATLKFWY